MSDKVSAKLYDKDYYLGDLGCEGSKEFNNSKGHVLTNRLRKVLDIVGDPKDRAFLDVGCGRGEIALHLLADGASRVVAVDYSKAAITIASEILEESERLVLVWGDAVEFIKILITRYFDFVLLIDVAEHMHDWELEILFTEAIKVLKPYGKIVVQSPFAIGDAKLGKSEMHVNIKHIDMHYLDFLPNFMLVEKHQTQGLNGSASEFCLVYQRA